MEDAAMMEKTIEEINRKIKRLQEQRGELENHLGKMMIQTEQAA